VTSGSEQRPWREYGRSRKPITSHQLAQLLGPYLIGAHSIRVPEAGADTDKRGLGYYLTDFEDAFLRYAPKNDDSTRDDETETRREGESDDSETVTRSLCHGAENGSNPYAENGRHTVKGENPENGAAREKREEMEAPTGADEDAYIDRLADLDAPPRCRKCGMTAKGDGPNCYHCGATYEGGSL
jgi:uncharacterized protein DUF3631